MMKGEIKAHGHLPWVVYHGHVQMHRKFVILGASCGYYPDMYGYYKGGTTGGYYGFKEAITG